MIYSIARKTKRKGLRLKRRVLHAARSLTDPSPKLIILVYHRVLPEAGFNPLSTVIPSKSFARQLDFIAKRFHLVSLREAAEQIYEGRAKCKTQVILTFDEGYKDNRQVAYPLLKKMGLPAAFFLATDYIGSKGPLWDWEIILRITGNGKISAIDIGKMIEKRKKGESALSYAFRIFEAMKSADKDALSDVIDYLRANAPVAGDFKDDSCMDWDDVRALSRDGMEIGSHGLTHRSLLRLARDEAKEEITRSKEAIESRTGKECAHFSFPFGSRRDYDEALISEVKMAGYKTCLLNIHGYNHFDAGTFMLKRIIMEESTDLDSLLG